jgi:hypothetical protein
MVVRPTTTAQGERLQVVMAHPLVMVLLLLALMSMPPLTMEEETAPLVAARLAAMAWGVRPPAVVMAMAMASSIGPSTPPRWPLPWTRWMASCSRA